ncbi:hydrogenase formation protein HypD [Rhizobium sp. NXC24]|uniref:hydrogenase formation protein HypD n=1 Tax=Rhizobium sp. NXC24 TaxID=2048897 RepID=UPI000CDF3783|nr:hydrogenase formation protein HypD [Rhizobium sp. NXC24]AVA24038.1 hydrogenase expression/formation protein HypD [Rhizobium sp. NXC24]
MKYIDEYRDAKLAKDIARQIAAAVDPARSYHFMEFCGGHTYAIARYGLEDLLPANVQMIHGPGCPVCVLPIGRIDAAIALAMRPEITLCTYGDLMRVPCSNGSSLLKARSAGADIRMVYSTLDSLSIAEAEPNRQVVFFAIGFETTTPPTALALRFAIAKDLPNFSIFSNHVLTPAAIQSILENSDARTLGNIKIDGLLGPAHVSTVIGTQAFEVLAEEFDTPIVVAGFEPLDVIYSILMLVRQVNDGIHKVENQYIRAVTNLGSEKAKREVANVFELRDSFEWRGLGAMPHSALGLRPKYAKYDAEKRFDMVTPAAQDNPACECGAILRGVKKPSDCKLFDKVCTPDSPMGSCMVSSEGACAAHWIYGRFRGPGKADESSRTTA